MEEEHLLQHFKPPAPWHLMPLPCTQDSALKLRSSRTSKTSVSEGEALSTLMNQASLTLERQDPTMSTFNGPPTGTHAQTTGVGSLKSQDLAAGSVDEAAA
jgi:hypothetical protein